MTRSVRLVVAMLAVVAAAGCADTPSSALLAAVTASSVAQTPVEPAPLRTGDAGLVDTGAVDRAIDPGEPAAVTGIPAGLPVFATANDKAVEALGSGLQAADEVLVSLGTYIASMTTGPDLRVDEDGRFWTNFGSVPGRYLFESNGIRRGMWTVSWFRDLVDADLAELNVQAAALEPGSGGLVTVLDWLAPADHPERRGAILGFDGTQGRAHLFRSLLEGIAMTMRRHTASMESALGKTFSTALVSGGGSSADLMLQILADVSARPAVRARMSDAAGLGAAICAAVGAGLHPDWQTAVDAMVRPGRTFLPRLSDVVRYSELAGVHDRVNGHLDPLFGELAVLYPAAAT